MGIVGAGGRMGAELVKALRTHHDASLVAAADRAGGSAIGRDAGELCGQSAMGVVVAADIRPLLHVIDVVIDFSSAAAVPETAAACAEAGVALLVGTTGLDDHAQRQLDAAATRVPVLVSANTSLALNVLLELVERAARALPTSYDIEIFEAHHRHKVDAPSGTALALGEAAAAGRDERLHRPVSVTGMASGARSTGGIGFSVIRGGDVVGEHDVRFLGEGEQLRLSHLATDRGIFAKGAVAAAIWLAGRPKGRYKMADFILKDHGDTK